MRGAQIAYYTYESTMEKCALEGNAFHGCAKSFLDDCMSRLKVRLPLTPDP